MGSLRATDPTSIWALAEPKDHVDTGIPDQWPILHSCGVFIFVDLWDGLAVCGYMTEGNKLLEAKLVQKKKRRSPFL